MVKSLLLLEHRRAAALLYTRSCHPLPWRDRSERAGRGAGRGRDEAGGEGGGKGGTDCAAGMTFATSGGALSDAT